MNEKERNYCCLVLLLLRVGNLCLRRYFKQQWDAAGRYTCPWTDCPQNGADLLRMFKPLPYEKNTVQSGDTSQWDLSLLVKVLLHSRPAFVVAPNLVTALKKLKEMRNQLCHSQSPRIKATDFQKSWRDGCNALGLFGATVGDFDKVEQDVQRPWSELCPMMKQCADQDQAILDGLDLLNCELERLQLGQAVLAEGQDRILKEVSSLKQDQRKECKSPSKGFLRNCFGKWMKKGRKNLPSSVRGYTEKMKSSIKQQTDFLLTSEKQGKKIRTDDIFTNVIIEHGNKHFKEPQERRFGWRQIDEVQDQPSTKKLRTCSEIFLPAPRLDRQKSTASTMTAIPKTILVTGKAGIGKSLFCQKLVRDWSLNRMFEDVRGNAKVPDFQFVFLLTFRQLVLLEEKEQALLNLFDILSRSPLLDDHSVMDEALLQYIIENPEKLLLVLDGYDEYKKREKITGDFEIKYPNNPHQRMPVPAVIAKIMKGKMLKGSVVLISSRPGEAEELKNIVFDVKCDIRGFSSSQVLEYIKKYFKESESMKKRVLHQIKTNEILLSFGHIPVMCFLMCYCIEWFITHSTQSTEKLPVTRTELYYEVIKLFIKKHSSSKYGEVEESKVQDLMHKLGKLAMNLTMEGKYIFDEAYLKKFKFSEEEITNLKASGLLDCCPGMKPSPSEKPLEYSFTHLTIQEFLRAFLLVEKKQIPEKWKTSDATFMFMAGLCCMKKDEKLMEKLIKNIKPKDEDDKRNKLLTLSCLYEYNNSEFSCTVIYKQKDRYCDRIGWIEFIGITDMDCLYISYLLNIGNLINEEQTKQHPTFTRSFIVNTLYIGGSSLSSSGIRMLCDSLAVRISTVTELWLCGLDDECVNILSNVLPYTNITELDLSGNKITDIGVKILCKVLSDTKITTLGLGDNKITDVGVNYLCTVIKGGDCPVKLLALWGNDDITNECKEDVKKQIPDVNWRFR